MGFDPLLLVYAVPLLALWAAWIVHARRRTRGNLAVLEDNRQAGLAEPPSLHPVIDPALCLGCGSCVRACPEQTILGLIDGRAALIEPSMCVGHGACAAACPTHAITLVFGTATRGVDIPLITPEFESSVPGVFIAGELGGMGLIRNAIEQGRQAIDGVARRARTQPGGADVLDTLIIGCGPAGIAASLGAIGHGLSFVTVEQATLGGTVAHFPRGKLVMTAPATLPLIGKVRFGEVSKERLLAFWEDVLEQTGLEPRFEEQVVSVTRTGEHFDVVSTKRNYRTKSVLLAVGRRGTPRTLDVPGEDLPKVVYRVIDPEQYAGRRVLVVGGGDSALEAAARIAGQPDAQVTLSHRGTSYSRARAKNREQVRQLAAAGRIRELPSSQVLRISEHEVELRQDERNLTIANDDVVICAGGLLPTAFLRDIGIEIETKHGSA